MDQPKSLFYQDFIHNILTSKEQLTYIEKVMWYIQEHKLDPYEIADIIKEDKTLYALIELEAKNNGFLKEKSEKEFDLSCIFDD